MEHLQYIPGDPRLVDQLVYELKSKGIFDQFRKECIADVDTRPAYQNLRQRVETSVAMFLSRQCWKPDLNKNQLREKLRKHILEGNYLEQGLERIVDQVVNPKVASVFIPQVEDLVYNYLGIPRKKASEPDSGPTKPEDLLPTDLEAVSPGSVKSNDDKPEVMDTDQIVKMEDEPETEVKEEKPLAEMEKKENMEVDLNIAVKSNDSNSMDKSTIPLPTEEIKLENIPAPINSPPKLIKEVELDDIALPQEPNVSTDIPLPPNKAPQCEKDTYFKPITHNSDDSNSSSDSSLIRNMSPLTPIRNYNNENSCDAQQGFEDDSDNKSDVKVPSSFRFTIEVKDEHNSNSNSEIKKDADKKKTEQGDLSYQFTNQVNLNSYNTPMYDDSSNSNNLHIDYESDINSKTNTEIKLEIENSQDSKKDKKNDDRKSHKSSHRSRDSSRHSNSKDKRSDSKHSTSRDSSRHDKKSSKEDKSKSSKESDKSKERPEKKDRDSSRHHDSSRSSHRSSKDKDSKSHKSSSSSHRHSSKSTDDRKTTSSSKDKVSDSSRDKSKDKPKDSKSSSSKSDRDRKSSSNKKSDEKDKKKEKKDIDDHYSSSGRGNHSRRSTDRDSNDGSSSSKGSQNHNGSKSADSKKDGKTSSSKSDNTSTSGESPSPSDKEHIVKDNSNISQCKPIIRVDNHLETPIAPAPRLPFVPDVTLKKPKFAANLQEAKKLMKMRKFLDEEQKRMNQEAALLLEFQANVRPSMSQVYSSISGPELEFACGAPAPDSITFELPSVLNDEEKKDTEIDITPSDTNVSETVAMEAETPDKATENIELKEIQETKNYDSIEEQLSKLDNLDSPSEPDATYDENKPFSELMNEITEYSKASEIKSKTDNEETIPATENLEEDTENIEIQNVETTDVIQITNSVENKYFEVTIITEELSESEETVFEINSEIPDDEQNTDSTEIADAKQITVSTDENDVLETNVSSETVTVPTEQEELAVTENETNTEETEEVTPKISDELHYFAEHEKYKAELERQEFNKFLSNFMNTVNTKKKLYLVNCDTYEENIMKEIASATGEFEIINYYKNGHSKVPNITNIVKDVPLSAEVTLPVESNKYIENPILFSPVKSECSFELCNDYDTKLDDINKKSRQEVMEIILGSIVDSSPSKMPTIDYYSDSKDEIEDIDNELKCEIEQTVFRTEVESETESLKRSIDEVESSVNNNRSVLTPKKMRKLSDSDQISSTTEESLEVSNNNVPASGRSKYLGRARRPGLARPKRNNLSSSPSSDKSVENYTQNTPPPPIPNGKIKTTPRTKVQRYDTSDLYKPKLHYLSRRHNVS